MEILKEGCRFVVETRQQWPVYVKFGSSYDDIRTLIDSHTATFDMQDFYLDEIARLMLNTINKHGHKTKGSSSRG